MTLSRHYLVPGFFALGVISVSLTHPAMAAQKTSKAGPHSPSEVITWPESEEFEYRVIKNPDKTFHIEVFTMGKLIDKKWNLLFRDKPLKVDANGNFRVGASLPKPGTYAFKVTAVNAFGDVVRANKLISMPQDQWEARIHEAEFGKSRHWSPGLGLTSLNYAQTGLSNYTSYSLTAKISFYGDLVRDKWVFNANLYGTVLPLSKSSEATLRFFGFNTRFLYRSHILKEPWKLSFGGGLYFTTTTVVATSAADQFGFTNLSGPQIPIILDYAFKKGDRLSTSFKFATVSDHFSILDIGNREIAFGMAYIWSRPGKRVWSVGLDWADLKLSQNGIMIDSKSTSLGLSTFF